ncbi:hypothetical protein [Enterovibrio baiacu]|uniref:hypothetical protein n=1 Tax=Enterovibrio baiacu TaxID=2491023 RepID=UPI003D109E87
MSKSLSITDSQKIALANAGLTALPLALLTAIFLFLGKGWDVVTASDWSISAAMMWAARLLNINEYAVGQSGKVNKAHVIFANAGMIASLTVSMVMYVLVITIPANYYLGAVQIVWWLFSLKLFANHFDFLHMSKNSTS